MNKTISPETLKKRLLIVRIALIAYVLYLPLGNYLVAELSKETGQAPQLMYLEYLSPAFGLVVVASFYWPALCI